MDIKITEHICLRYIERFNQNLNAIEDYHVRLNHAEAAIKAILKDAHYVSDNLTGVLLFSEIYNCCVIVKDKKLITIFNPNRKNKERERKYK